MPATSSTAKSAGPRGPATRICPRGPHRARGFTLIELVTLIVIVGVLSFVALPPLLTDELQVAPAADRIAAEVRYAQSLAMTRGAAHSFEVSGNTYRIRNEGGAVVPLSNGDSAGNVGSLSLSGSSAITFSSLFGQPGGGGAITVSGGGTSVTVTVAANTGYVRVQ